MIASLRGVITHVGLDQVVVEVGGVGMIVHTTPATAAQSRVGAETSLSTTLIVREDSLTIYGFAEAAERALFEQVQKVSGVGPRLALALLAVHSPDEARRAIAESDVKALTKVPGVGKKSAERLVLELQDKVEAPAGSSLPTTAAAQPLSQADEQLTEALTGLGWSQKQAEDAVATVRGQQPEGMAVADLLRLALRELGR